MQHGSQCALPLPPRPLQVLIYRLIRNFGTHYMWVPVCALR